MSTADSISVVGQSIKVVEHDGLTIEEVIGNAATKTDALSVALVSISKPTREPWLTLHYDEYMHVTEGAIELHHEKDDGSTAVTKAKKGQTAFIPKGSRVRPVFPEPAKYIPVCLPAFSPERCIREEEGAESSEVSARLGELHRKPPSAEEVNARFDDVRTIYHMCQTSLYDEAVAAESAYYPPTFRRDGNFTHATAAPAKLIDTANHFYTSTEGDWMCVELDRDALERLGIVTIFESAKPVGDIDTDLKWKDSVFPHIFGGLPVHVEGVVKKICKMKRDGKGTFLSIDGLVG